MTRESFPGCLGAPPLAVGSVHLGSPISGVVSKRLETSGHIYYLECERSISKVPGVTKLRHYDNLGTVRFVTFSTFRREPTFVTDSVRRLFVQHLSAIRERRRFTLLGYVIMPEHIHLVFRPTDDCMVGRLIGELKSRFARDYFARNPSGRQNDRRVFWQRRCFDHNCRTPHSVWQKVAYCHNNPVRRGLVGSPSEWKWSSYNWYHGVADVPIAMDTVKSGEYRMIEGDPQQGAC